MTIQWGDTGKIAYGALKTFAFACATPREVALGSTTLPSAEGVTNQVSFTVQQSDLPTITPNPLSMKYVACVIVSGKVGASATNVSYRIFKNGTSLATTFGAGTATQYWSHNHWRWFDVSAGDVLDVRVWSNQTDTTIDYAGLMIYPAAVVFSKPGTILKDVSYTNGSTSTGGSNPNPTGAGVRSVTVVTTSGSSFPIQSNTAAGSLSGLTSPGTMVSGTPVPYSALVSASTGLFRTANGGDTTATFTQVYNDTTTIRVQKNGIPTTIFFREILR